MEKQRDDLEILRILYQERKWLIISVLFAGILAIIATSFMQVKYKATATVFPPGFNSADRMLENPQFGYNIEADRLIQIGNSINLKDSVIEYFNLVEYYKIDQNELDWKHHLLQAYEKDINFERTKYMSVQITVLNRDPDEAKAIVEEIISLLSRFWERLFKNNMIESLNYAQKMYVDKQTEVSSMLDSIYVLRGTNSDRTLQILKNQMMEKKVEVEQYLNELAEMRSKGEYYDYGNKVDLLSEEILTTNRIIEVEQANLSAYEKSGMKKDSVYLRSKASYDGALRHKEYLQKEFKNMKETGKEYQIVTENLEQSMVQYQRAKSEYENLLYSFEPLVESVELDYLEARYVSERNALNQLKEKFEKAHRYFNEPLPNLFVIESPRAIYKKAKPSYLLNVAFAMIGAFVVAVVLILFGRSLKEIRRQLQ